jgi:hypothetical protein
VDSKPERNKWLQAAISIAVLLIGVALIFFLVGR